MCVCIYIYIYIYIYTHTHTYAYTYVYVYIYIERERDMCMYNTHTNHADRMTLLHLIPFTLATFGDPAGHNEQPLDSGPCADGGRVFCENKHNKKDVYLTSKVNSSKQPMHTPPCTSPASIANPSAGSPPTFQRFAPNG